MSERMEAKKETRGRKIPVGESRGPRDKLVGVYFSEEEIALLDEQCELLGYRSKSSLISDLLSKPLHDGFSTLSFIKLGKMVSEKKEGN